MEANERTSLRLVYGLKFAKNLPDKSLDGANIFDYFEEPKSPNPQNIYYRNLDSNKAKCLEDPNICGKHQTSFSRFRQQLKRPYAIEASVSFISGNRPTISVANSSSYEKQHISAAGFFLEYVCQSKTERNHQFGAKVDNFNQILSTPNSDCEAHLESLAVENREYDFVYFGSITDNVVFNWIARRQFFAVEPKVEVGAEYSAMHEIVCPISYSTGNHIGGRRRLLSNHVDLGVSMSMDTQIIDEKQAFSRSVELVDAPQLSNAPGVQKISIRDRSVM